MSAIDYFGKGKININLMDNKNQDMISDALIGMNNLTTISSATTPKHLNVDNHLYPANYFISDSKINTLTTVVAI